MADRNIKFVLDAENKANGAIDEVRTKLEQTADVVEKKLGPAFKKMAQIGTASFLAITGEIGLAVKAYSEAEVAIARVDQTLENVRKETGMTTDAMVKVRDSIMDASKAAIKLGFDDEDAAESLAKFYQRTNDVTEAQKLSGLAMDLARAKNIDLMTATNLVNLALSGSGRALMQYGIVIKDAASPTEALGILMEKVGGQAGKFADTLQGKLSVLKVQVTNLQEAIGKPFADALSGLLTKLQPVIDKFVEWADKNPELVQKILIAGLAITGLVAAVGFLGMALPAIITGFSLLLGPVGLVILAIGAVAFAVSKLGIDWGALLEYLKQLNIIDKAKEAWNALGQAFQWVIDRAKDLWNILNQLYDYFVANILPILMTLWDVMVQFVQPIFEKLWQTLATRLWPALVQLWNTLSTQLFPALLKLWDALQPLVIVLGAALYGAFILVIGVIGIMCDAIATVITWIVKLIDFIVKTAVGAINLFSNALNGVVNAFKAIVEWGQKAAQYIGGGISSVGGAVGGAVSGAVSKVTNFITGKASGGPVSSGTPYIVGENGPELFVPGMGGRIIPNAGGTLIINVTGNDFYGEEGIADRIGKELMRVIKQNVKL
jgi:hypothetical protein